MISVPPKTHEGVMKRSEGSFSWITLSVYVIICVTPTSVRLWNATQEAGTRPVCIHELTHVIASTWSHGARWSGPICGLQHIEEQHTCREQTQSAGLLTFYMRAGVHVCLFLGGSLLFQDFSYDDSKVEFNVDAPNGVVMEGYLFKRASNAFKTWNR